jgi:hypothetical protein
MHQLLKLVAIVGILIFCGVISSATARTATAASLEAFNRCISYQIYWHPFEEPEGEWVDVLKCQCVRILCFIQISEGEATWTESNESRCIFTGTSNGNCTNEGTICATHQDGVNCP